MAEQTASLNDLGGGTWSHRHLPSLQIWKCVLAGEPSEGDSGRKGSTDKPGARVDLWVVSEMTPGRSPGNPFWKVVQLKRLDYVSRVHLDMEDPELERRKGEWPQNTPSSTHTKRGTNSCLFYKLKCRPLFH